MKKAKIFTILLITLTLVFTGCKKNDKTQLIYAPESSNHLVIYTSHKPDIHLPIIQEFERRTGIWVKIVSGGTNQLLEKIEEEGSKPEADLIFGGGVENLESYKDILQPYVCAETKNIPSIYLNKTSFWTPFSALPLVLVYNKKLVKPSEINTWTDLFNEKFDNKIAYADPNVSGSSFTALATLIQIYQNKNGYPHILDEHIDEFINQMTKLFKNGVLPSSGDVVPAVADGSYLVGITLEEAALKALEDGEEIGIVYPKEGTSCVPDGCGIIKNCKHPDNARLFIDFILGKDVQRLLGVWYFRRPLRTDVNCSSDIIPLKDIKKINYDVIWVCNNRKKILDKWNEEMEKNSL